MHNFIHLNSLKGNNQTDHCSLLHCVAVLDTKVRKFVVTSETVSTSTEAMET